MQRFLTYLRQHHSALKWVFLGAVAFSVVFDCFVERHHPHFWGDHIFGFWSMFAFAGCVLMIALFKGIYYAWLMKETNYYDD